MKQQASAVSNKIKKLEQNFINQTTQILRMAEKELPTTKMMTALVQDLIIEWHECYSSSNETEKRYRYLVFLYRTLWQPTFKKQIIRKSAKIKKHVMDNVVGTCYELMDRYEEEYGYEPGIVWMDRKFLNFIIEAKEMSEADRKGYS